MHTSTPLTVNNSVQVISPDYDRNWNEQVYQEQKRKRDQKVQAVEKALKKHGVAFQKTATTHIVIIDMPDTLPVYLSLKSRTDNQRCTYYLYRVAGTDKWLKTRRDDFFSWVREPSVLVDVMTFGKYKGQALADVLLANPGYLEWLYGLDTTVTANLRHTVALLLNKYSCIADDEISDFLPQPA